MTEAKHSDTVRVHYTGKLEDGSEFDSSRDREPLEFTIGDGEVIAGFELAVAGMSQGESKTATIAPEHGYGPRRENLIAVVERSQLPAHLDPSPGQQFSVEQENGQRVTVTVTAVSESTITMDANHELAGKTLIFDLELVEIL